VGVLNLGFFLQYHEAKQISIMMYFYGNVKNANVSSIFGKNILFVEIDFPATVAYFT
jgi:hypothetical protein